MKGSSRVLQQLLRVACLWLPLTAAQQEPPPPSLSYTFDFTQWIPQATGNSGVDSTHPNSQRLTYTSDPNSEPCYNEGGANGAKLVCTYQFGTDSINATTGDITGTTTIQFTAVCDADAGIGWDFRRARNCGCQATVLKPGGSQPLICPCTVCQPGFGENPVNVDCSGLVSDSNSTNATTAVTPTNATTTGTRDSNGTSTAVTDSVVVSDSVSLDMSKTSNTTTASTKQGTVPNTNSTTTATNANATMQVDPFIVNNCISLDCFGNCNGTCSLNCDVAGNACPYCSNNPQNIPTASPTGSGDGAIRNFGDTSAAHYHATVMKISARNILWSVIATAALVEWTMI